MTIYDSDQDSPVTSPSDSRHHVINKLNQRVHAAALDMLDMRGYEPDDRELDYEKRPKRTNLVWLINGLERFLYAAGRKERDKHELSLSELQAIDANFDKLIDKAGLDTLKLLWFMVKEPDV